MNDLLLFAQSTSGTRWTASAAVCAAALPAGLLSWAIGWLAIRSSHRTGLLDRPGKRKLHARAVPLGGGVGIWAGVVMTLSAVVAAAVAANAAAEGRAGWRWAATFPWPAPLEAHLAGIAARGPELGALLIGSTVLMLLGLVDDRRGLDWRLRIAVQTGVAAVTVAQGWRLSLYIDAPLFTAAVSVAWIVTLINAFNFLDNMDGLSAGVAAIAAAILCAVMLLAPDPRTSQPQLFVAGYLAVLVGALLGFLVHNRPPARLFMGDAGAYLIGYHLATATIMATFAGGDVPRHAILAPLCVLAVPLYDTATVVAIRLRRGRSPFEGDTSHFSHRLVELGLTGPQAVATIYLTSLATGLGALLLYQVDTLGAAVILLMVVCVLAVIAILETTARRSRRGR